jgi:hypothetical protein
VNDSGEKRRREQHARRACGLAALLSAALTLSGCRMAPSVVLFGAAFPDWLFCMAGGVAATVVVHVVLSAAKRVAVLEPLPLSYPALTAIFAVLIWLLVFHH